MAITVPDNPQPKAMQRVVRGPDGRIRVILIDLKTLLPISDPQAFQNYQVVNSNPVVESVVNIDEPDPKPTVAPQSSNSQMAQQTGSGLNNNLKPSNQSQIAQSPTDPRDVLSGVKPSSVAATPGFNSQNLSPVNTGMPAQTSQTQQTAQPAQTSRGITPGAGLANLTSNPQAGIDARDVAKAGFINDFSNAGVRKNTPSQGFIDSVTQQVGETFGPGYSVKGTSGQGPYGGFAHRDHRGVAMDMDVIDPTGQKVTDDNKMSQLATDYAFSNPQAGIGYGAGYMEPGRMHLDLARDQNNPNAGKEWGANNSWTSMDPELQQSIDAARAWANSGNPTPTPKGGWGPSPTATGDYVRSNEVAFDKPSSMDFSGRNVAQSGIKSLAEKSITGMQASTPSSLDNLQGVDVSKNPAALATAGYMTRTPEELDTMAQTISREISPDTMTGMKNRNPESLQEFANVVSSIENRAAMDKYKDTGVTGVVNPSQYMGTDVTPNTKNNYSAWGDDIKGFLTDYYTGNLGVGKQVSSYYNPDKASPDWGDKMQNAEQVGDHRFGYLNEYRPGANFEKTKDQYSRDQVNNMTSKGGAQPDLGRFGNDPMGGFANKGGYAGKGTQDSPGEGKRGDSTKSGTAGGYSGKGGLDSPSEGNRGGFSGSSTSPGKSQSNHSAERERDTSLGGKADSKKDSGKANADKAGSGGPGSKSSDKDHSKGGRKTD